jgi:hypothetical protein
MIKSCEGNYPTKVIYKQCEVSNLNLILGASRDSLIERVIQNLEILNDGVGEKEKGFKVLVERVSKKEKIKQIEDEKKLMLQTQKSNAKKKNALDVFDDDYVAQEDINEI